MLAATGFESIARREQARTDSKRQSSYSCENVMFERLLNSRSSEARSRGAGRHGSLLPAPKNKKAMLFWTCWPRSMDSLPRRSRERIRPATNKKKWYYSSCSSMDEAEVDNDNYRTSPTGTSNPAGRREEILGFFSPSIRSRQ